MEEKERKSGAFVNFFKKTSIPPEEINPILERLDSALVKQSDKMFKVFSRPKVTMDNMLELELVSGFVEEKQFG